MAAWILFGIIIAGTPGIRLPGYSTVSAGNRLPEELTCYVCLDYQTVIKST